MSFTALVDRHAKAIMAIAAALVLAGAVIAAGIPVSLFPQVPFPRVVVDLSSGDRPAAQTVLAVTKPAEEALRAIPGVHAVRSNSSRGSAQISVDFGWGRDMVASTLLVDAALAQTLPSLPAGTGYEVRRMDPTVFPIISYALSSHQVSQSRLRDLAALDLAPRLASIAGISRVAVQGGEVREIQVEADVHRLAGMSLSLDDLATAVASVADIKAVGRVQDRSRLSLVIARTDLQTMEQLRQTVVRAGSDGVVRLSAVAHVGYGHAPNWINVAEDGHPAVLLNVYQQPDGNAVAIAAQVRDTLGAAPLPGDVKLISWYDQSQLVSDSQASVRDAVAIGLLLAGLVLFAFLRNLRIVIVALIVVPSVIAVTALVLGLLGMTFNIMTLGGIAAAVGLVIDDVIVVVEHIARRAGAGGGAKEVLPATREFLRPLTGSSLATIVVFVPLSFLGGVTGEFSRALSITMASALVLSYLFAAFVVPLLARRFIDFGRWQDPGHGRSTWLSRTHARVLTAGLERPRRVLLGVIPLLVLGVVAWTQVPSGFMPKVDEGGFVLDFRTPPGTALTETERQLHQLDALLRSQPEVETFSRRTGTGLGGDLGEPHHGDYFVRLRTDHQRSTEAVMAAVRSRAAAEIPGLEVESAQLMEDLIGDLTAVPQPIEVRLYAQDPAVLPAQAKKVADIVAALPGLVEVKNGINPAGDGLDVQLDPVRVAMESVRPADVTRALDTAITGVVAARLPARGTLLDVRVRSVGAAALTHEGLAALPIRAPDGHVFPLSRVASIHAVSGEPEIGRDDLQPMIAVTARLEGQGLGAAAASVKAALDAPGALSPGVRYAMGGLYEQQQQAFLGLIEVFVAAFIAELILLMLLYESVWTALAVVVVSALSTTAVFTALWVTGVELNITALMGMTMVVGISTEMAIFLVSEYQLLATRMPSRQAVMEAAGNRLRPITMTTLAAILTLLPLAMALGRGAGIQQPLAISIIAGLALQYVLVLLLLPAVLMLLPDGAPRGGREVHAGAGARLRR
ncbi:efflux RND transporter permease subunit [Stenotrophomonas sp. PD6]|uniref:efflux RND transporter permease subunit n=1 Tax=Stenotrophomonas sp. PD6 TaxID=3368612 RepID=UPI003BA369E0